MQLAPLTPDLEPQFWSIVKQDYCDYYFFIYDWLLEMERTQIFLALEDDAVAGLMVIYNGSIAQLRGEASAVQLMLTNLTRDVVDVQVPQDCESLLLKKYPAFKLKAHVTLMSLKKGEEQPSIKVEPQRLTVADAQEITALMHESYPEMWSDIPVENVRALMTAKEAVWLGIKWQGKLTSFGYAMLTPKVSHVTWIATCPQFENRGYATSIASALIKECLAASEEAIIYVMDDNAVAKRVYLKTGFRPYKSYFFVKT